MFWIIVGGTLSAFCYLFIFSLCKAARQADSAIELNLQEIDSESAEGIDNVLFENPFNATMHEDVSIPDNAIESCEDFAAIAKMRLAGFRKG